jgi:hypothetical protein
MAKPSRSKQPDFDPREIDDLIFTPAVGSGVGSHLINPPEAATVVRSYQTADLVEPQRDAVDLAADMTAVAGNFEASVVNLDLWRTESGDIVPESRVRRISVAQDILSVAEKSVYDALWNSKQAVRGDGDAWRIVQAGYHLLGTRTRLSRKTIQRIIDRLLHKDFITIERPADIYKRTSTTYRVFSYWKALDLQGEKGHLYAVKIGPGYVFAEKLETTSALSRIGSARTDRSTAEHQRDPGAGNS